MNSSQNPILKRQDISFSEQRIERTLNFYKQVSTELRLRRNIHNERYKSKLSFFIFILKHW